MRMSGGRGNAMEGKGSSLVRSMPLAVCWNLSGALSNLWLHYRELCSAELSSSSDTRGRHGGVCRLVLDLCRDCEVDDEGVALSDLLSLKPRRIIFRRIEQKRNDTVLLFETVLPAEGVAIQEYQGLEDISQPELCNKTLIAQRSRFHFLLIAPVIFKL